MSKLLIDCNPMMVLPPLVDRLDGHIVKAMLLQQIHFMLKQPRSGVDHNGHHWVWFSYEQLCEDYFTWLSPPHIAKCIRSLEGLGLLVSTSRIRDSWDNTKYYRIDYDALDNFVGNGVIPDSALEGSIDSALEGSIDSALEGSIDSALEGRVDSALEGRVLYTETSTDTPTENLSKTTTNNGDGGARLSLADINRIYENEIGMFTAIIAETVADDFDTYGGEWLRDAITIAAKQNVRRWNYVQGVLRRWRVEGRQDKAEHTPDAKKKLVARLID